MPYDISREKRDWYREISARSRQRKKAAIRGELQRDPSRINKPVLELNKLMPQQRQQGLRAMSLFSGGGGLDLGFERAGFEHIASFDALEICGATLRRNRPQWQVFSGQHGNVTKVNWAAYKGIVDLIHGGPPCQPFSIAGKQNGSKDTRDMWPAFIDAVMAVKPKAFVAENVPGLLDPKFSEYVNKAILAPLEPSYHIVKFKAVASEFGVPQVRKRIIFVGFKSPKAANEFEVPQATHFSQDSLFSSGRCTLGASGLPSKTVLFCKDFQKTGSLKALCTKSLDKSAIPFVRR